MDNCCAWVSVRPTILAAVVAVGLLASGPPCANAAYRLTFRNGTSVEVSGYEDLGDVLRYPRLGGTVAVAKADVVAIEETSHLPPPTSPGPPLRSVSNLQSGPFPPRPVANASPALPPAERPATTKTPPQLQLDPLVFVRPILGIFLPVILFGLGIAGLAYAVRRLSARSGGPDGWPYRKAERLLTPAERAFYAALCTAVEGRWPIFVKVRLGDLLEVPYGTTHRRLYRDRIDRKHVDFVLCASDDLTPLLAIELDDASHARVDRRERDAFVDRALDAAGLPILRVPARRSYAPGDLRGLIEERVTGRTTLGVLDDVRL